MIQLDFSVRRSSFSMKVKVETDAQVTGLFGRSGSGKTTLLEVVAGILRPEQGSVRLAGQVYYDRRLRIDAPPEQRSVGMVFQDNRLFPHLDVKGNLLFGQRRLAPPRRHIRLEDVVDLLDLRSLLKRRIDQISGGEARRVALGRALLMSPEFLLLDEPLTGLHHALRDRILAYLLRLKRQFKLGMLYVSHSLPDVMVLADYVVVGDTEMKGDGRRFSRFERAGAPREILPDLLRSASGSTLETVLHGKISRIVPEEGVALCETGHMSIWVPVHQGNGGHIRVGSEVFVTVGAQDLLLAFGDQVLETSARNRWPGYITNLFDLGATRVLEVDVGEPLLVEITPTAFRSFNLEILAKVHVLSKVRDIRVSAVGFESDGGAPGGAWEPKWML
jgi:molybdate transport system ATP-binding protein